MFFRKAGISFTRYQDERRIWRLPADRWTVAVILALLIAAPFLIDRLYIISYLLPLIIWSMAAMGLNLLMGGAGQIHLGYGAVIGIGAYASVHAMRAGVPFELAMILGGVAAAAVGVIFGAAALRVKGLYLAMATLAMQYIVDFVIVQFPAISGGSQAALAVPRVSFLGIAVEGDNAPYYVALAICTVLTLFMLNVRRTSFGRALAAVREKDYAASIIGVDPFRYKLLAFWVSSFIGGMTGAVLAVCYYRTISPDQFHLDLSIQLVAMVIVGGLGSVLGVFLGVGLILFAPIVLNQLISWGADQFGLAIPIDLRAHLPLMLYGALIMGFLLIEPLGLAKIYNNIRNYFLVWPFRHARQ
ncbi:branched-chain amino acid ABC transporter permease [Gemmobacter nectariphilus]|uniref:branched-chain amino acid ABC transporter permease n=1 Tax=Gemmobacter nectariphilus TaxID=220343 RepID=UPI00040E976E|nr:branched-chain amino acid ABC transporter permease [Gemmobacter nectariphilus]